MAALIRHGSLANPLKSTFGIVTRTTPIARVEIVRHKSKKKSAQVKKNAKLVATQQSLSSKGFLRAQKPYQPPENVCDIIDQICQKQAIPIESNTKLEDPVTRFNLLVGCEEELKHSVPNSLLYSIETIGDVKEFYKTPIDTTTPYDALRKMDLPKNLCVNYDYTRFHPDTDTMFNGRTAFPKSSTIVTGLKYKKKYPGLNQEDPFMSEYLQI